MLDFEIFKLKPEAMRQERKWFIEDTSFEHTERIIKSHPAMFSRIFSPRYINNLYLATENIEIQMVINKDKRFLLGRR